MALTGYLPPLSEETTEEYTRREATPRKKPYQNKTRATTETTEFKWVKDKMQPEATVKQANP